MSLQRFVYLIGCCLFAALLPWTSLANEPVYPEMMFILDGSGSMWAKAGGEVKIEAARRVLQEVIPSLPAEVDTGLAVYGHNRKGDCTDIEMIGAPGAVDRQDLLQRITQIQPKGKTPIADSIKMVVEQLRQKENETVIVLVSDGEETCRPDPCGVVRALKETGIRFVLHVVGFDVNEAQKTELSCLAEAGGGTYFGAADSAALLSSLQAVQEKVETQVRQAKTTVKKARSGLGKLQITIPQEGLVSLNTLKIKRAGQDAVLKTIEGPTTDSSHPLPAGDYELVAGFANVNYQPDTEVSFGTWRVQGGETTLVSLGVLVVDVSETLQEMPVGAVIVSSVDRPALNFAIAYNNNPYYLYKPKPLPEGTYDLNVHYKPGYLYQTAETPVRLAAGIAIGAGGKGVAVLDTGIRLKQPESGGLTGFELVADDPGWGPLKVEQASNGDYPLWQTYGVVPGTYRLNGLFEGMAEPLPLAEGIEVGPGELIEIDTGL